jgi:DtxR family transcriptional regulator, Mn-dependent transcriptional regulator
VNRAVPLPRLQSGQRAQVIELRTDNHTRLARLGALGLMPGSWIVVLQKKPALVLRVGETEISLDEAVAGEILVRPA